jgi:hypothetical protein
MKEKNLQNIYLEEIKENCLWGWLWLGIQKLFFWMSLAQEWTLSIDVQYGLF